jgi:GYF domain 2
MEHEDRSREPGESQAEEPHAWRESRDGWCGGRGSGERWRELRRRAREARKERVLHTRVSDRLADDIRGIAEDLRVPVSNLVRNVLEEVFDAVESVSDDLGGVLEEVMDEAEGASRRLRRARQRVRQRRERRRSRPGRDEGEAAADVESEPAAGPPPPPIEWHLLEEGRRRGPLGLDELGSLARAGRVGRDTRVWCAGMTDWRRAGDVDGLARLFEPPPPPGATGEPSRSGEG